jgi:hypothetical protein
MVIIRAEKIFTTPPFYILVGIITFIVLSFAHSHFWMCYEIANDNLRISIWGTCFTSCQISQIVSVKRSYHPCTPQVAGSFKKLKIIKTGFPYLISPVREQEFLDALKEINPNSSICVSNTKGWWRFWDWDI